MARYNKTPKGMQLQAQTPGEGGRGGIATLPNPKAMPQVDPHQQDYANWYKQVTGQGYTPMYRSPLDGKPYQVDSNGLRTAVDEQTFQTVYPSELGNTGGSQWGGPQSKTLQPAEWNVPDGQWATPMQQVQPEPQQQLAMGGDGGMGGGYILPQQGAMLGGPVGVPGNMMPMGGGMGGGMMAGGGYQPGVMQDPAIQRQLANFFTSNVNNTQLATSRQAALTADMTAQSDRDMNFGTGWGGALGGLASFFTGDPGFSKYAEKQAEGAYKRRQELAGNTNDYVNNVQQNMMNGFNILQGTDPQSIKNQTAMANAMANASRAQAYGQSINNNMQLGQQRISQGWAGLAQRDRHFAQTAGMAQQRLQMDMQRLQLEGQRVGMNQQQIDLQKQRLAQDYDLALQRMADQRSGMQMQHEDRMLGLQQDYDQMEQQNQQFWGNQQNQGYQHANEQGYDSNTQQPYFKYSEPYRKQFSKPAAQPGASAGAAGGGRPLDAGTAQQFLQQAGGDKAKARQLAAQAGFKF